MIKTCDYLVYGRCSEEQLPVVTVAGAETDPDEAHNVPLYMKAGKLDILPGFFTLALRHD
jgi:hypothetical protein